ncbi:hypothetical protein [Streptomyces geranii]|uniref:hypothetical protein n=1 Tax=Streptomyces geranii TaxID=2058923 RepID=UPI000D02357E|nr:hypothetical protein [Streptomyces geranii]
MRVRESEVTPVPKAPATTEGSASRGRRPAHPRDGALNLQRRYGNHRARGAVQARLNAGHADHSLESETDRQSPGAVERSARHTPDTVQHPHGRRDVDAGTATVRDVVARGGGWTGPGASAKGAAVFADRGGYGLDGVRGATSVGVVPRAGGRRATARLSGAGPQSSRAVKGRTRYTTTDGPVLPWRPCRRAGTTADAADDTVRFESADVTHNGAAVRDLVVEPNGDQLGVGVIGGNRGGWTGFRIEGDVTATGPAELVGAYSVGFLQTVFKSTRKFYYKPTDPTSRSRRVLYKDTVSDLPAQDSKVGRQPWMNDRPRRFQEAAQSTRSTSMQDSPWTRSPLTVTQDGEEQRLVGTGGEDQFRSWLAVRHNTSHAVILLDWFDWRVGYGTRVRYDAAGNPTRVRPDGSSGLTVTGQGAGPGWRSPRLDGETANDRQRDVWTTWRW